MPMVAFALFDTTHANSRFPGVGGDANVAVVAGVPVEFATACTRAMATITGRRG
jgi:hypothetical protein